MLMCVCACVCAQACEKDSQCGGGLCCAVSLWIRSLRMCTPMGQEGDDCHPMSHTVRLHLVLLVKLSISSVALVDHAPPPPTPPLWPPGSFRREAAAPHVSLPTEPGVRHDTRGEVQVCVVPPVPRLLPLRTRLVYLEYRSV